jgi:two-component system, cell cycle sensor histidine kinase and response regulator CckA
LIGMGNNNNVQPILAFSDLLRSEQPEDAPTRQGLEMIYASNIKVRDLVNQLLMFSRLDVQAPVSVNLSTVSHDALTLLQPTLPDNVDLQQHIEAVPVIAGDKGQLQQLITNLVINAAQAFGSGRGTISVELAADDPVEPRAVRLTIRDNGCGIEPAIRDRIFEPFFTTREVGQGTGLGLAMVHGIVESHGGIIHVDSIPGDGTCVTVILPVRDRLDTERELVNVRC